MSGTIGSGFGMYSGGDSVAASTITGVGTANFVARFTAPSVIGDGIIQDDGTTTGVGRAPIATSYMTFAPATISLSSLNIETSVGVDVAASLSGDIWWNGTNLKFNNGASVNFLFSDLLGANNGIATLNGSGVVPNDQLPFNLMEFLGNWNATTNTPTLANTDVGAQGNTYKVSVAGTVDFGAGNITFDVGDWVVNNGTIWEKVDNTDAVTSVNGNLGAVTTPLADVLAQGITTGANNISVDAGQNIIYNNGLFATTFGTTTLTGNQAIVLPNASGTVALTSDIQTLPELRNTYFLWSGLSFVSSNLAQTNFAGSTLAAQTTTLLFNPPSNIGLNPPTIQVGAPTATSGAWQVICNGATVGTLAYQGLTWFGAIKFPALTGNRTWTMPDASGTVALTSDIPAAQDLAATLAVGNTTNGTDISVTSGDNILLDSNEDGLTVASKLQFDADTFVRLDVSGDTGYLELNAPSGLGMFWSATDYLAFEQGFISNQDGNFIQNINYPAITQNVDWQLPDASGTVALTSDIPAAQDLAATLAVGNTTGANDISVSAGQKVLWTATEFINAGAEFLNLNATKGLQTFVGLNGKSFLDGTGELAITNLASSQSISITPSNKFIRYTDGIAFSLDTIYPTLTAFRTQTYQDASGTIALVGDTISPTSGGTGITTYTTGDILYASAANVLSKRAIGTVGQVLTVAGGVPTWAAAGGGETLAQTLAIGNSTGANDIVMSTELNSLVCIVSDNVTTTNRTSLCFVDGGASQDTIALTNPDFYTIPATQTGLIGVSGAEIGLEYHLSQFEGYYTTINSNGWRFWINGGATPAKNITLDPLVRIAMNSPNGSGFQGIVTTANLTVDRTYTFQDASGTVAFLSDITGGGATLRNVSSTDTFATANETINCTANTFTVNLPTAVGIQGTTYTLVNSGTGTITLDGNGTETINGSLTIDLVQYISRTVQSDNANWIII